MASTCIRDITPNHEAYLLLGGLIDRAGLRKYEFLARLADLGYCISDDTFTNWGRLGRTFPRDWSLLRAMLRILSEPGLDQRCSASEALRFCYLTGLPFSELQALAQLFPAGEFELALIPYLPESLVERIVGST
jgi:hypothetical protein